MPSAHRAALNTHHQIVRQDLHSRYNVHACVRACADSSARVSYQESPRCAAADPIALASCRIKETAIDTHTSAIVFSSLFNLVPLLNLSHCSDSLKFRIRYFREGSVRFFFVSRRFVFFFDKRSCRFCFSSYILCDHMIRCSISIRFDYSLWNAFYISIRLRKDS